MGLFDRHDYGRDYGGGRGLGDRMRGAWNRFEHRLGAGHGRGYDRETMQGGRGGYDAGDFAYRGTEPGWSTARNRGAHDPQWDWRAAGGSRYDQDMGPRSARYGGDYGARGGYDRDLRGRYDGDVRGGRDRMRTDAGDPFGDRQSRTPFRVMRGGFDREATDRGGWHPGPRQSHLGHPDRYDVQYRGWNGGVGDEPGYRGEDFRNRGRGGGWR